MEDKKEMNLLELLSVFGQWLKRIFIGFFRCLGDILRLAYHYFWVVLIVTTLFIAVGVFFTRESNQLYKGDNILYFTPEAKMHVIKGFDLMNTYCSFDKSKLASMMEIDEATVEQIRGFYTYQVIDLNNDSIPDFVDKKNNIEYLADTMLTVMSDRLGISIRMYKEPKFEEVQRGIVRFFEKQPELSRIDSTAQKIINERITFCDVELARLDSLSDFDYFNANQHLLLNTGAGTVQFEPSRRKMYYEYMRDLLREKQILMYRTTLKTKVVAFATDDASVYLFPRYIILLVFAALGCCVGLLCAWGIKRRKEIAAYFNRK